MSHLKAVAPGHLQAISMAPPVAEQVLATGLTLGDGTSGEPQGTVEGHPVRVTVNRAG